MAGELGRGGDCADSKEGGRKGSGESPIDYREVTLMPPLYKVYATM